MILYDSTGKAGLNRGELQRSPRRRPGNWRMTGMSGRKQKTTPSVFSFGKKNSALVKITLPKDANIYAREC
jgi:hypothetical protein